MKKPHFFPTHAIPDRWKEGYGKALTPLITFFHRLNAHPNLLTTVGFGFGLVASLFAATGSFWIASLFLLLSGLCDTLDGKLARTSGKVSRFGALYDSSLDRYSEILYFLGLAFYFIKTGAEATVLALFLGMGGSMMVSYVRARAESLGLDCHIGFFQRAERVLLLAAGGLIHPKALIAVIWIIALSTHLTAIHRIWHVRGQDRSSKEGM